MAAWLVFPGGSYRLHLTQWSAPVQTRSGVTQVRDYTVPYTYGASQNNLQLSTRTRGDSDRQTLLALVRGAQVAYLRDPASKTTFWWPERDIAWEGVPTNVEAGRAWDDVAPIVQVTMLLTRNMVATQDGWVTGQDGSKHVVESVIDHVFQSADQQFAAGQDNGTANWKGVPYAAPSTQTSSQKALQAGVDRLQGN